MVAMDGVGGVQLCPSIHWSLCRGFSLFHHADFNDRA